MGKLKRSSSELGPGKVIKNKRFFVEIITVLILLHVIYIIEKIDVFTNCFLNEI